MAKQPNLEKVFTELEKTEPDELYAVYITIKDFFHKKLTEHQKQTQDKASELQSKINKIQGD